MKGRGTPKRFYYASPGATKYDFQDGAINPRGLVVASMDTFGAESTIAYDEYDLMPLSTTDALGMTTSAVYDYRVMQPSMVTDPNGNRSLAVFTPLGMLFKTAIQGKVGEDKGDTLEHPTSWLTYNFFNYAYNGKPIWVQTTVRERHWYDYPYEDVPTQTKVDYSDGFGRLLQSRVQAEDVIFGDSHLGDSGLPASQSASNQDAVGVERESTDPLNVIVSGWQVYNNKGAVVEKYEPFYDKGFDYQPPYKIYYGRKVQMFYDPRGQVIRTLNPDGTEQKVIYGRPVNDANPNNFVATPWETTTYDANDLDANNTLSFGTPKHGTIDAMGRVIETFELNRYTIPGTPPTIGEQEIRMRFTYDIRGNLLTIHNGITVDSVYIFRPAFSYDYDLKPKEGEGENEKGGNVLHTWHLDSGHSYELTDTLGKPVITLDSKGAKTAFNFDALKRPTMVWSKDKTGENYSLRIFTQYGDNSGIIDPQDKNLKGKVWQQYDEAGRLESPSYDFKGNPLFAIRRVISVEKIMGIFCIPDIDPPHDCTYPNWEDLPPFRVNWDGGSLPDTTLLDSVDYRTDTEYDALNRPTQITYPAATVTGDSNRRVMVPSYNKAGALDRVDLKDHASATPVNYVERIAYNAQNQRILLALGNGLMTRYAYDPRNSRLLRLKTEKYVLDHTGQVYTYEPQSGCTKQDYAYSFDSLGNILSINDETPEGGVGGSTGLTRNFEYDALYRLLRATGRENSPYNASVYGNDVRSLEVATTKAYYQNYSYDELGNILTLSHVGESSVWTRNFVYDQRDDNNLLDGIDVSSTSYTFQYDACGNQTRQNADRHMQWDYANRLRAFYIQATSSSEPSKYAQYLYDAGGRRTMKIVRCQGGNYSVRLYISEGFEVFYKVEGTTNMGVQNELSVMDDTRRIATIWLGEPYGEEAGSEVKYCHADQVESSMLQTLPNGTVYKREEYYPFGETSFGSYDKKRYRFSGKEKDEESGMYYYGARYYVSWTCRFVSVDPMSSKYFFWTSYLYAGNSPVVLQDINGMGPDEGGGASQPQSTQSATIEQPGPEDPPVHGQKREVNGKTEYWDEYADAGNGHKGGWVGEKPTSISRTKNGWLKDYSDDNAWRFNEDGMELDAEDCIQMQSRIAETIVLDIDFDTVFQDECANGTITNKGYFSKVQSSKDSKGLGNALQEKGYASTPIAFSVIASDYNKSTNTEENGYQTAELSTRSGAGLWAEIWGSKNNFLPKEAGIYVILISIGDGWHSMSLVIDKSNLADVKYYLIDQHMGYNQLDSLAPIEGMPEDGNLQYFIEYYSRDAATAYEGKKYSPSRRVGVTMWLYKP